MLPKDIPDFHQYPRVSQLVTEYISMQFDDVRSMIRLPLPALKLNGACNFAVSSVLCNLISGLSVSLYQPQPAKKKNKRGKWEWIGAGEAFKKLLEAFYPCDPSPKSQFAKVMPTGGQGFTGLIGLLSQCHSVPPLRTLDGTVGGHLCGNWAASSVIVVV